MTRSTKIIALVSTATCIFATATAVGVYVAVYQKESALEEIMTSRAERAAAEKEYADLSVLMEETRVARADLDTRILNDDDSVISFLAYLESLYASQGLTSDRATLGVEKIKDEKTFEYLVLDVSLSGSFDGVTTMMSIFESLPYQVRVQNTSIERVGGDGTWRGVFKLYVTKYIAS